MKVLLGIGGSDDSLAALRQTVERAQRAGDDLTVAIVDNPESDRSFDEIEAEAQQALDEADCDAEIRHLEGDPGSELVRTAEAEGYGQVVIGGGEQSSMGKIRLGPIAEFVLLNSHVTVTLVR
ncbi:MAG: universal stress protein [Halobacteriota archaeon]|uniref:universal stress protein n=1 Tax=Halanaeroarchaeum sp. HSR-CO TaxID=2866382 RepID=UPI00217E2166|nr:universal stress protein [Halanaeroarchaeum sp. HSR-CO]UWG46700.1 Nucleotide-binding protein, UspA family [Halanaeroarchaeum sp. HSR-CO]